LVPGDFVATWKEFVLFVLLTALLCTYGFIICSGIIWNIIHANRLFEMYLLKKYSLTFIAQFLIYQGGISFSVGLFAFILAIMLYVFAGSHLYMVCINDTTNESFKWKEVKQYQKEVLKALKHNEKEPSYEKRFNITEEQYELSQKKLVTIYNKGIVQNFKEFLFPPALYHSIPSTQKSKKQKNKKKKKKKKNQL